MAYGGKLHIPRHATTRVICQTAKRRIIMVPALVFSQFDTKLISGSVKQNSDFHPITLPPQFFYRYRSTSVPIHTRS